MPGPNARPPVSFRALLLSDRAVRRVGKTVEVRFCGTMTGAGIWIECSDADSAATTARRIFAFLNQSIGEDDYNMRIKLIGRSAEQEAAELNLQPIDQTAAIAETREEQKKTTVEVEKIVTEVTEHRREKGLLFDAAGKVIE